MRCNRVVIPTTWHLLLFTPQAASTGWAAGLWPLIKVVACDVPIELAMYAASVLVNVSNGPQPQLQRAVRAPRRLPFMVWSACALCLTPLIPVACALQLEDHPFFLDCMLSLVYACRTVTHHDGSSSGHASEARLYVRAWVVGGLGSVGVHSP